MLSFMPAHGEALGMVISNLSRRLLAWLEQKRDLEVI